MRIGAVLDNAQGTHVVTLTTESSSQPLSIAPRPSGYGSSVNGGELLFAALATCYCNDIYREAKKRGIDVKRVHVEVDGEFGAEGEPATNVRYQARIAGSADEVAIRELMRATDRLAEIHNTLRIGTQVRLEAIEVEKA